MVRDIVGDAFYSNCSCRGKIAHIRQYAEVVLRKLLDLPPEQFVTVGNMVIRQKVRTLPYYTYVEASIETITQEGNSSTHTQNQNPVTENDFDAVMEALLQLLSYLLILYFDKYGFGSRPDIMCEFSLLPPIIRYKVLSFLYEIQPDNIAVIDKLALAIRKAFDQNTAEQWLEKEREHLSSIPAVTVCAKQDIIRQLGTELAQQVLNDAPKSMYHLCKEKLTLIDPVLERNGLCYTDFESALTHYKHFGQLSSQANEVREFCDLLDFLYLGRKESLLIENN